MNASALRNMDLNLLLVFSVLMRERSVSRAAERLFIGQSGMSGALARLRLLFDDPLLIRVGRRLEPTPRALGLVPVVDEVLGQIERAIGGARPFHPRASRRTFTIGLSDNHELLFAPALARALFDEAPDSRLVVRPVDVHSLRTALDEQLLDAAVSVSTELPSWHDAVPLFEQGYACVWSRHQVPMKRLTTHQFTTLPHVMVTFGGDLESGFDAVLAEHGLKRRVILGVPRFSTLPGVLDAQPLIATVPLPVAESFAREHRLALSAPPVPLPARQVRLVFRRRDAALGELVWFRALVARTLVPTTGRRTGGGGHHGSTASRRDR
jgi:LysR family transcriptional activator of mexEF-oprN operon